MHKIVNPQQIRLFDSFDSILTEKARKRLMEGRQGVFRFFCHKTKIKQKNSLTLNS